VISLMIDQSVDLNTLYEHSKELLVSEI